MKKLGSVTLAGLAALAVAATASADRTSKADRTNAAAACTTLQTRVGATTFAQTYGASSQQAALRQCVSQMVREAHQARHAAAKTCATKAKGKGKGLAKAKAACVAKAAKTELKQKVQQTENAAQQCKTERAANPAAFQQKYGTNTNKRNAFGKCVSTRAKQQNDGDGDSAGEQPKQLRATLTAVQGATGSGTFTATLNLGKQQLCYTLTQTGVAGVTAAHIHVKPSGEIVVPLAAPTDGTSSGCVTVARSLLQQVLASPATYYVNVHVAGGVVAITGDLTR